MSTAQTRRRGQDPGAPGPVERMMSFGETAEYLGVSSNTLRKYVRQGLIPAERLAGTRRVVRFRKSQVDSCFVPWTRPVRDRFYGGEQ